MHSNDFEDDLADLALASPCRDARAYCADGRVPRIAGPPTPAEFRALVTSSRPVIFTGCTADWPALSKWTHEYLRSTLGDSEVHVALTPDGLGDAVVPSPHGGDVFVKPHEALMRFSDFCDAIESPLVDASTGERRRAVHYASHQDSSLSEFEPLRTDTRVFGWADEAFGEPAAATNFWMGEDAAHTTVHADLYDNLYAVTSGCKLFQLLPPQEARGLQRRQYRSATYRPAAAAASGATDDGDGDEDDGETGGGAAGAGGERSSSGRSGLRLALDEPEAQVIWASVDLVGEEGEALRPVTATVGAGDVLYLPALWWHAVSQRGGAEGTTTAINFWYMGPAALGDAAEQAADRAADKLLRAAGVGVGTVGSDS